jgi:hypothetical protein
VGLDGGDGPRANGSRELAGGCVGCRGSVNKYFWQKGRREVARRYDWNNGCGCVRYNGKKAKPADRETATLA